MNKEIRKQLKCYTLTKNILDERFKGKKFKTDTGAGTFFCYDALYYGNDCISPDEYKLHELVDWIKTLLGTGANVHHPILHHINKEKAIEVVNEIIEIIKEKEEKSKICKEPEHDMYDMIDEMKKQEKENMKKQKATLKLADGREIEVEISEDELKKFAVKKSPYCDLRDVHKYEKPIYYIHEFGRVDEFGKTKKEYLDEIENKGSLLNILMQNANCYNDKAFAEKCARADLLMRKLRKFAVECNISADMTDRRIYSIWFDGEKVDWFDSLLDEGKVFGSIVYFLRKEDCEKAIEEFKDELIWYFKEYVRIYE